MSNGTIADQLQKLVENKKNIKQAILEKNPTKTIDDSMSKWPEVIASIPTSVGSGIDPDTTDIMFIDYDGTILYGYSVEEANALTALPNLPTHDGLINQGWNFTLEEVKHQANEVGKGIIGCTYITSDGNSRFHITISDKDYSKFAIGLGQSKANGVMIDWGDGTSELLGDTTNYKVYTHQYDISEYPSSFVITLIPQNDGYPVFSGSIVANPNVSSSLTAENDTTKACLIGGMYDAVELGKFQCTKATYIFAWMSSITKINIPDTDNLNPNNFPFMCDYSLKSMVLPRSWNGNGLNGLFKYCYNLEIISMPGNITYPLNFQGFYNCTSLKYITYPYLSTSTSANVYQLFYGCNSLKELTLPKGITKILGAQFRECSSLKKLNILAGEIDVINDTIFYGCSYLTIDNLVFSSQVTYVSSNAFQNTRYIKRITFKGNITNVYANAFNTCFTKIFDFSHNTTVPTLANINAFQNSSETKEIVVPDELYDDWITATNWSSTSYNIVSCIRKFSESSIAN